MTFTESTVKNIFQQIEALSEEERALLLMLIFERWGDKRQQQQAQDSETQEINKPDNQNPLLMVAATLKNNPLFHEVTEYIQSYRREIDAEIETGDRAADSEERGN